jgi:nicotine blue oxidoreductase
MPHPTIAVVLAAGGGTRFVDKNHKLLAGLPDSSDGPAETVSTRAVRRAVDAGIGPVVVVTGAVPLELPAGAIECHNPSWADGQATSLQAALDVVRELGATSVVVGLAAQPGVTPEAWRRVAAADAPIAVATYDGRRGNPVGLSSEVWHLLPKEGDEGARRIMRVRADLVREVPCTGSAADIDTVEDLARWQKS